MFTKLLDIQKFHMRAKTVLKVVKCVSNVGEYVNAADCLLKKISSSCKTKGNQEGKLLNAYTRLDSVVGMLKAESYHFGTLLSQVTLRKMEHRSTAKILSFFLDTGN